MERDTPCIGQEYVEGQPSQHDEDSPLARRMARVESLLETLLERSTLPPISGLAPTSTLPEMNEPQPPFNSSLDGPGLQVRASPLSEKLGTLRQNMTAMLPLQADIDFLLSSSHGWWLIQQHMMTHLPDDTENDFQGQFNVSMVSEGPVTTIARLLLCIAICIQQLSPTTESHEIGIKSPRVLMNNIIEFINRNVTSDDEVTGSIEGVECLALQGIYEVNAGNLRKSWLSFRKAITVAQLLGLHRVTVGGSQGQRDSTDTKHQLWYQVSRGVSYLSKFTQNYAQLFQERYLSTLLGIPSGTGSSALPFDDNASWLSREELYHKHLYEISGLILSRNQENSRQSFCSTQKIAENLESLAGQMPSTWWEIPTKILNTRTKEASTQFERVMCQIWHFELEILLHLPLMLRAATDRRHEYSRISCLDACRNLIKRWISIRENNDTFYFSDLLDFEAFTAATTLLLGLFSPQNTATQDSLDERCRDSRLVEAVVQNFERLKTPRSGLTVGDQSISVIRTLQKVLSGKRSSGNLRLEIPFFGVIKIARSGTVEPLEGERMLGANAFQPILPRRIEQQNTYSAKGADSAISQSRHETPSQISLPEESSAGHAVEGTDTIFQFAGGHFQLPDINDIHSDFNVNQWSFSEDDMIFFDSLINTDLVGDWTF